MKKSTVSLSDFQKMDLRAGKVLEAGPIEGSTNLLRLRVDLGYDYGIVQIVSGIARWYKSEDLQNKKFVFVANLEEKKMMGQPSRGMILCADVDHKAVVIAVDESIPEGTVIR